MTAIEKITKQFIERGFVVLSKDKTPKKLLWQPDLLFSKNDHIYPVLIKSNNSILPTFLNRIATIPSNNIVPINIFAQKPPVTEEKYILSSGVGVGCHSKGRITYLNVREKLPKKVVRRKIKRKKLHVIDIFISSKQEILERKFVEERIEFIRKVDSFPFNPPHLIEYDKFNLTELYQHIDDVMENCEWIVIILEENPSEVVEYEINKAIEVFDHDNIFIFVKSTKVCHNIWKKELEKVKHLKNQSIKYIPYTSNSDLEVRLVKSIRSRISEISKKENKKIFN